MKKLINTVCLLGIVGITLMYILMLTSCTPEDSRSGHKINASLKWRCYTIKDHRLLFVENLDSLAVRSGDTVNCQFEEGIDKYWITNTGLKLQDTLYLKTYVNGSDTTKVLFQMLNVVLDERVRNY